MAERLDQASDAAERLVAEAAAEVTVGATKPPPAGWAQPDDHEGTTRRAGDIEQVVELLRAVRQQIPPELQQRLAEALRQLLLAVRALVDWYLARLEQRHARPVEVQDIPVM